MVVSFNKMKSVLKLNRPILNDAVVNFEMIEKLWDHAFGLLELDPSEHKVFITEAPNATDARRIKKCEMMFETFNVESLYIGIKGLLSMYTVGLDTGVVLSINPDNTYIIPCYEEYLLPGFKCRKYGSN